MSVDCRACRHSGRIEEGVRVECNGPPGGVFDWNIATGSSRCGSYEERRKTLVLRRPRPRQLVLRMLEEYGSAKKGSARRYRRLRRLFDKMFPQ